MVPKLYASLKFDCCNNNNYYNNKINNNNNYNNKIINGNDNNKLNLQLFYVRECHPCGTVYIVIVFSRRPVAIRNFADVLDMI